MANSSDDVSKRQVFMSCHVPWSTQQRSRIITQRRQIKQRPNGRMAQLRMFLSCFSLFGHKRMPNIRRRLILVKHHGQKILCNTWSSIFLATVRDGFLGTKPQLPSSDNIIHAKKLQTKQFNDPSFHIGHPLAFEKLETWQIHPYLCYSAISSLFYLSPV